MSSTLANQNQMKEVGQRIRQVRHQHGMSLRSLATELQINFSTLAHWERGEIAPGEITLRRLAYFLGVDPVWLRTGESDPEPKSPAISGLPADDLKNLWGLENIDLKDLPPSWPEGLRRYIVASIKFGLFPSSASLAQLLERAQEMGTDAPLSPELRVAVQATTQPNPRQHGLIE